MNSTAAELAEAEYLSQLPKEPLQTRSSKKERADMLGAAPADLCPYSDGHVEEKGSSAPPQQLPQRKAAKERPVLPPEIQKLADAERKEWRQFAQERVQELLAGTTGSSNMDVDHEGATTTSGSGSSTENKEKVEAK
mmetsp:Transcript_13815/g.34043  ORF Transcript_13815/g.34043 Transcript_13815/m.34043 type:complete len:137 (-) Transcript_13815:462-872(-)|eukprot:g216.t1